MALLRCCLVLLLAVTPMAVSAQARFDLAGPKIEIKVTRGQSTLPIAAVPNLQPGDTLWLHPDFPSSQSVHYLLIAVFLRGTTNPPPDDWFTRIDTWNKRVREEGVFLTVPAEAQQAILFLAPETGGDFSTLRSAVKGRPGIFVRASQDLTEAGFEQARIEKYLAEIKHVPPGDAAALQEHSNLLARTLALKPNPECFKRPPDQQYTCLTQTGTQLLLDDGHGQTMLASLSNGPSSDFINAASYTNVAGGGNYSAYVGAIVDLVRLTSTLHTAQYQYIPAIAFPDEAPPSDAAKGQTLNLRLNTPPSFHNPKSVIVIGLPAVQKAALPPLRPAAPGRVSCLLNPEMVLPIEGAPLVFSTSFAHDLVLHLNLPETKPDGTPAPPTDLPLVADAFYGGLTIDHAPERRRELTFKAPATAVAAPPPGLPSAAPPATNSQKAPAVTPLATKAALTPGAPITGTIRGFWGFDAYTGPTLPLQNAPGQGWRIVASPETPTILIAGKPNHLQIEASGTACVQSISLEPGDSKVEWQLASTPATPKSAVATAQPQPGVSGEPLVEPIEITLNLQQTATTPGSVQLGIQQFGARTEDHLGTKTFAEPATITSLQLHSGDLTALLDGSSLDQVEKLTFSAGKQEFTYTPSEPPEAEGRTLTLALPKDAKPLNLKPNEKVEAQVHLRDGRTLQASTTIRPPRPSLSILSRHVTPSSPSPIQLTSQDDLPLGAQLTFFLKSKEKFPRNEVVEISSRDPGDPNASSGDAPLKTTLSIAAGSLVMQDNHTVLATFDPLKTFGPSTFGQFRFRAVTGDGTPGEWAPLATIVRLPTLTDLRCPPATAQSCQLSGSALYLIDSVSADTSFTTPVSVPEGFVDSTLSVPHPLASAKGSPNSPATLYIRLRDDPASADAVTLPILPESSSVPTARQHATQGQSSLTAKRLPG